MYDTSGKYVRTHRYNPKVEDSIAVYCTHVETGEDQPSEHIWCVVNGSQASSTACDQPTHKLLSTTRQSLHLLIAARPRRA